MDDTLKSGSWAVLRRWVLAPPLCRDAGALRAAVRGKTVLITGASYGIGEATALLLGRAGAHVVLLARSHGRLLELAATLRQEGHHASPYALDLSAGADIGPLVARVLTEHPRIDVIISNAGISLRRQVQQASERHDLTRSLAVNFSGPAALISGLLPGVVAQGGGQIVNVSSVAARLPGAPRWASYQGSKAGFDVWLRSVAGELGHRRVTVSSVYLPLVRTRMSAPIRLYAYLPALTPHEAALVIAQTLVRPAPRAAPRWLVWAELAALLWPGFTHRVLSWTEALTPKRSASPERPRPGRPS